MAGRQAKILSADDIGDLLTFASVSRHPLRNRVIVLLSAKAGLRAGEIAQLTWDMESLTAMAALPISSSCATAPRKEAAAAASPSTLTWLLLLRNAAKPQGRQTTSSGLNGAVR